jgi:hypothetical protein
LQWKIWFISLCEDFAKYANFCSHEVLVKQCDLWDGCYTKKEVSEQSSRTHDKHFSPLRSVEQQCCVFIVYYLSKNFTEPIIKQTGFNVVYCLHSFIRNIFRLVCIILISNVR